MVSWDDGPAQVVVLPVVKDGEKPRYSPRLACWFGGSTERFVPASGHGVSPRVAGLRSQLLEVPAGRRRRARLEQVVRQQAALVLDLEPSEILRDQTMRDLGMGSLMAIEMRALLEASSGLTLSTTLIWSHPTVELLATHLAVQLEVELEPTREPVSGFSTPTEDLEECQDDREIEALLLEVEQLSSTELELALNVRVSDRETESKLSGNFQEEDLALPTRFSSQTSGKGKSS